jgi:hypothetical protein
VTCGAPALNFCGGCAAGAGSMGAPCTGSNGCTGTLACSGTAVICMECLTPGACQVSPGTCAAGGTCTYPSAANGETCNGGDAGVCNTCLAGACVGLLTCSDGGACDPVLGCLL